MTTDDILTMAKTIYGEARGESWDGKVAVAWVMRRRAELGAAYKARKGKAHPLFGDGSIESACLRSYQFSCWNSSDPNRKILEKLSLPKDLDNAAFRDCLSAALAVMDGRESDNTKGATHYKVKFLNWPRDWGPVRSPTTEIGNHSFYII